MRRRAAPLALLLLIALAPGCRREGEPAPLPADETTDPGLAPGSDAQAEEALRRIVEAERTLEFSGYRMTVHGEPGMHRETEMRVVRKGGRTLLELGHGADPEWRWQYRTRFRWIDDTDLLLSNYRVELAAGDAPPVAWRETRRVRLAGRRAGRPSLTLLVDRETWLPLHEELRDHEDRVVLTSWFESLEYGAPDDLLADVEQLEAEADADADAPEEAPDGEAPLRLGWIPAGFAFVRREKGCDGVREYWSDGLAAFVVSQREASDEPGSEPEPAEDGRVHRSERQGRVSFSGLLEGVLVRVTGYLAPDELEAVVRGLRVER